MVLADAFPGPDHAEPGRLVQGQAGGVLREDAGLDGPDPGASVEVISVDSSRRPVPRLRAAGWT
jgi:hypothetical protein